MLRIDPGVPIVWRSPTTVQFGVDRPLVRLEGIDAVDEHLLHALELGTPEAALGAVAVLVGGTPARADALLALLAPALEHTRPTPTRPTVALTGHSDAAAHVGAVLAASGIEVLAHGEAQLVVLVAEHTVPPAHYLPWLADDVPHLPIVFGDAGVQVGPLVRPGSTPCLHCGHAARVDDDPAWPTIAAQLAGRSAGERSHRLAARAALVAVELIDDDPDVSGRVARRIDLDGQLSDVACEFHPSCACRSLDRVPAPLAVPAPSSSRAGFSAPGAARARRETATASAGDPRRFAPSASAVGGALA